MKKLLLFTAMIVIAISAFTQNFPIDTVNANWIERNEHGDGKDFVQEYFRYYVNGDTIINAQKFYKLYEEEDGRNVRYMGAFREVEGKVYYKGNDYWEFNTDSVVLLYDFTADIGDTVLTGSWQEHIIQDIDSVIVDGQLRKRLYTNWDQYWIEGIGSMAGFLYPISEIPISYWRVWISCYYIGDDMVYHNPEFHDCYTLVGTSDFQVSEEITIAPNPVSKGDYIKVENIDHCATICLFDLSGRKLWIEEKAEAGYFEINTANLSKGLYILKIENTNLIVSRKVIIE
jgi:hypothetical protein